MKPKMWPRWAQESFLGEISSLEIKLGLKKAFLVKSLAEDFQDVAKMGPRKLSW